MKLSKQSSDKLSHVGARGTQFQLLLPAWLLCGDVGQSPPGAAAYALSKSAPIARVVAGLFVSGLLSEKETAQRGDELGR